MNAEIVLIAGEYVDLHDNASSADTVYTSGMHFPRMKSAICATLRRVQVRCPRPECTISAEILQSANTNAPGSRSFPANTEIWAPLHPCLLQIYTLAHEIAREFVDPANDTAHAQIAMFLDEYCHLPNFAVSVHSMYTCATYQTYQTL